MDISIPVDEMSNQQSEAGLDLLGHVACSPRIMASNTDSSVGLDNTLRKSPYPMSGIIVISPEYFWDMIDWTLLKKEGATPSSVSLKLGSV